MVVKIANAFSLQMLGEGNSFNVKIVRRSVWDVKLMLATYPEIESYIGHKDTANIVSGILGVQVEANRRKLTVNPDGDLILVAQYEGERLPEGATTLPEGAKISFFTVLVTPEK